MKIKTGFMLRDIAGSWVVVPISDRTKELNGLIALNETGAFLWKELEKEASKDDLLKALAKEYELDELSASEDIEAFLRNLMQKGLIE